MSEDIEKEMEIASLLQGRYYMILNNNESESFSMAAYDTNVDADEDEDVPAGKIILCGLIELLENDFDRVWDAGMARLSFASMVEGLQIELEDYDEESITDKVLAREDNVVKVKFNSEQ